jgi:transcriptional regulator of acetoin/glycerol metabolism
VLSEEARRALVGYPWPGNVRELENVIERAAQYATHGSIGADCLSARVLGSEPRRDHIDGYLPLEEVIERHVEQVLRHTGGNVSAAARILRVSRRTLHRMALRRRNS